MAFQANINDGTDNGFFGSIASSVADTFAAALPVWTAQQLDLQRNDQLRDPLFVQSNAPPRADAGTLETTSAIQTADSSGSSDGGFSVFGDINKGLNISGGALILLTVGIVGAFLIARR